MSHIYFLDCIRAEAAQAQHHARQVITDDDLHASLPHLNSASALIPDAGDGSPRAYPSASQPGARGFADSVPRRECNDAGRVEQ